jgi:hypothetical protein
MRFSVVFGLLVVRLFFFAGDGPGPSDTLYDPLSMSGGDAFCSVGMVVVLTAMVDWWCYGNGTVLGER